MAFKVNTTVPRMVAAHQQALSCLNKAHLACVVLPKLECVQAAITTDPSYPVSHVHPAHGLSLISKNQHLQMNRTPAKEQLIILAMDDLQVG